MTEGWEGFWQKMTDDNDEAGGRREKNTHSTIRHSNHGNAAVKVKPVPCAHCDFLSVREFPAKKSLWVRGKRKLAER